MQGCRDTWGPGPVLSQPWQQDTMPSQSWSLARGWFIISAEHCTDTIILLCAVLPKVLVTYQLNLSIFAWETWSRLHSESLCCIVFVKQMQPPHTTFICLIQSLPKATNVQKKTLVKVRVPCLDLSNLSGEYKLPATGSPAWMWLLVWSRPVFPVFLSTDMTVSVMGTTSS